MILGLFLLCLGLVFLLRNLGLIILPANFWAVFYPIVLIVLGLYLALAAHKGRKYKEMFMGRFKRNGDDET